MTGAHLRRVDPAPTMRPTTGTATPCPAPTMAGQRTADARRDGDAVGCFSCCPSWGGRTRVGVLRGRLREGLHVASHHQT